MERFLNENRLVYSVTTGLDDNVTTVIDPADAEQFQRKIVRSHAGCTEPVRLTGHTFTIGTTTGEALRSYSTSGEPTGSLLTACDDRRASRRPACSRRYAGDTHRLIRACLSGGKNVPDTVHPPQRLRRSHRPPPQPPHRNRHRRHPSLSMPQTPRPR